MRSGLSELSIRPGAIRTSRRQQTSRMKYPYKVGDCVKALWLDKIETCLSGGRGYGYERRPGP